MAKGHDQKNLPELVDVDRKLPSFGILLTFAPPCCVFRFPLEVEWDSDMGAGSNGWIDS